MSRRSHNTRNDAGSLLATTFVFAIGSGCVIFLLAAMAQPTSVLYGVIGSLAAAFLMAMIGRRLIHAPAGSLQFWNVFSRSHRNDGLACQYEPRLMRGKNRRSSDAAPMRPILAEEVREIQQCSNNTWVPARCRSGGRA